MFKVDLTASWAFEYSELDSIVQLFHDLQIFRVNLTVKIHDGHLFIFLTILLE